MIILPQRYHDLSGDELVARIAERKSQLGPRLVILGHHYQRDEVIQFADFRGDSLKLSQLAAEQADAEFIVFCGVHFMAESADVLSSPDQTVCLPNLRAGCAMADMADAPAVQAALGEVQALAGGARILPITYVNSTAAIKAVTADAGGACCTSSNVRNVFAWALSDGGGQKIFAIPDQHLGRNTAHALGYDDADCALYDPEKPNGGLSADDVQRATFLLWKGYCHVHQVFAVADIEAVRAADPEARVIVHPECPRPVVAAADEAGSTSQIIRRIADAPAGSHWVVATEGNLVRRLAGEYPDRRIELLGDASAACWQMGMIDLPHLLWSLDAIVDGEPVNVVRVAPEAAANARIALQQMIDIPQVDDTQKR